MELHLWPHPAEPSSAVDAIHVEVRRPDFTSLRFRYIVEGRIDSITIPEPAQPLRGDRLWETTCFEAFLKPIETSRYREFNFAPSGRWAAYEFEAWRAGMVQTHLPAKPEIRAFQECNRLIVDVALSLDIPPASHRLSVTAIIDEGGGRRSFWALKHPPGEPDFHDPACFALELPAPERS